MPRFTLLLTLSLTAAHGALTLDQRPAVEGEWGYRPAPGARCEVNPPGFSWRPTSGTASYELQVGRGGDFATVAYQAGGIRYNVHCPPQALPAGDYVWRDRALDTAGAASEWSEARAFTLPATAVALPLPAKADLLARVPAGHPRLFVRPEQMDRLRQLAAGDLKPAYDDLRKRCDDLLVKPPPTAEPPRYPEGMVRSSEEWLKIWWGNRTYTVAALDSAATLAFTWRLSGHEPYGQLARRLLLDCARWDPLGATGFRYNDEAGMPYNWGFARTYTFLWDLLSPAERAECQRVMKIRGDEMFKFLCPRHFWQPYNSHNNRAWHKLGEIGLAFLGEVEGADEWVWFAMNVFCCTYPVWSDDDGGWHEGSSYWYSYLDRFTWWADIMRAAFNIDAYDQPYFAKIGYYPLYLMPPGAAWGGFGDLTPDRKASGNVPLVSNLAAQAGNGHWQWYVEQMGGPTAKSGYVGYIRGALPPVKATAPNDLPTSRLFRGTGQACLNSTLSSAADNVQVVFKSSPFGTQSHGYEANNSFILSAFGKPLLIQTGRRDTYGSEHHRDWMWSTRSVNNILVNGRGQVAHSATAHGEVVGFATSPGIDAVVGEAAGSYRVDPTAEQKAAGAQPQRPLESFRRAVILVKPDLVIVWDRLRAKEPATFDYWLHAPQRFAGDSPAAWRVTNGEVSADLELHTPTPLTWRQTDQYDPNPRDRVKVREWHLTASTSDPRRELPFLLLARPTRPGAPPLPPAAVQHLPAGYLVRQPLAAGEVVALLPTGAAPLSGHGLTTQGELLIERRQPGQPPQTLRLPAG
ncbi:MAG: DUF4962 domain-containing protein [Fimbriimonadaceae bacterium]|nr:DUF4962 domain-containing protein [Fimbriimonadaceae bacterium]